LRLLRIRLHCLAAGGLYEDMLRLLLYTHNIPNLFNVSPLPKIRKSAIICELIK
jgi:hypothetical protein